MPELTIPDDGLKSKVLDVLIYLMAISLTSLLIYYALFLPLESTRYANIFLGLCLSLYYLNSVKSQLELDRSSIYDTADTALCALFAVLSLLVTGYIEVNYDRLMYEANLVGHTNIDLLAGGLVILLVIDVTRRAYGNLIGAVIFGSIVYAFMGPLMPGIFHHAGMDYDQVIRHGAIELRGVYGRLLVIGATWIAIFIIFAGFAKEYGFMEYILDVSNELKKRMKSGSVHVAVITSMAMGSITGSSAANTATTGSFTIPMMKNQGVEKKHAAAIESVASSGGQLMPPIMGVAAFLMADILGISYFRVIQAGLLPAVLFYVSVAMVVHLLVFRFGWTTERGGKINKKLFFDGIPFIPSIVVLLYALVILRFSPLRAGLYTIGTLGVTMFISSMFRQGKRKGFYKYIIQTIGGFKQGALDISPLVPLLGALGIIISMLTQTGFSQSVSAYMISAAGGSLVLLLFLAMLTSILFGLGMPSPAAYLIVILLAAPPLIEMGVGELNAHMFVFYFAILSAFTPPVAVAVAVGSQIAESDFLQSAVVAMKIGSPGFLIPYAFITNPNIVYWTFPETIIQFAIVLIGMFCLVIAIVGYDGKKRVDTRIRSIYFLFAMGILYTGLLYQIGLIILLLALFFLSYYFNIDIKLFRAPHP